MSDPSCIILVMQTTWTKRSYVCDPDSCDTLIEVTSNDRFGFPSAFSVTNITCLCGRSMNQVSEEDATIRPINERNKMETVTLDMYNPHSLVTLKKIINTESGDAQFELYKVTELEGVLDDLRRRDNLISQRIEAQESKIGQIIDNLTAEGWYNPNVDKEEVLKELCTILDHNPQQEMSWSVTLTVSGTTMVNLDEAEDFDIRYHLNDNLSVDSNDFDTNVDSWDIDLVDSQEWN